MPHWDGASRSCPKRYSQLNHMYKEARSRSGSLRGALPANFLCEVAVARQRQEMGQGEFFSRRRLPTKTRTLRAHAPGSLWPTGASCGGRAGPCGLDGRIHDPGQSPADRKGLTPSRPRSCTQDQRYIYILLHLPIKGSAAFDRISFFAQRSEFLPLALRRVRRLYRYTEHSSGVRHKRQTGLSGYVCAVGAAEV